MDGDVGSPLAVPPSPVATSLLGRVGLRAETTADYEGRLLALIADGGADQQPFVALCRELIEKNKRLERERSDFQTKMINERAERENVTQMLQAQQGLLNTSWGSGARDPSPTRSPRRPAVASPGGMRSVTQGPQVGQEMLDLLRELDTQLVHVRGDHPLSHLPQGVQTLYRDLDRRDPSAAASAFRVCGKVATVVDDVMGAAARFREMSAALRGNLAAMLRKVDTSVDASGLPSPIRSDRTSPVRTPPRTDEGVFEGGALRDALSLSEQVNGALDRMRSTQLAQLRADVAYLHGAGAVGEAVDLTMPQLVDDALHGLAAFTAQTKEALRRERGRTSRRHSGRGTPPALSSAGRSYLMSLAARDASVEDIWDLQNDEPAAPVCDPDALLDGIQELRRDWDAMRASQGEAARQQALSVLRRLNALDAARLQDAGAEAILRTVSGHVDNLQQKATARVDAARGRDSQEAAMRRSLANMDEMIAEMLADEPRVRAPSASSSTPSSPLGGRRSASPTSSRRRQERAVADPEAKMAVLQRAFHDKKERLGRFTALVRRCETGLEQLCSHFDIPSTLRSLKEGRGRSVGSEGFDAAYQPLMDALEGLGAALRQREQTVDTRTAEDSLKAVDAAFEMRKLYELVKIEAGEGGDLSFLSGDANHSGTAGHTEGAKDKPTWVDFADFERAIGCLGQRVKDAELSGSTLRTQLRLYIARVQSLIQTYDYRPPAQRHVHIGDVLDADLLGWGDDAASNAVYPPGIRDLEELLQMLVKGGGDVVTARDALLDSIETDLRLVLPQVESMLGVPATPDDVAYPVAAFADAQSRLCATMARWRRVVEHNRQSRVHGAAPAERVLLCTIQHVTARLKAALDNPVLADDEAFAYASPPRGDNGASDVDSIDIAVSDLDHYTAWAASVLERLAGERSFVQAAVEAMATTANTADHDVDGSSPTQGPLALLGDAGDISNGLVHSSQGAVRTVADLSGRHRNVLARHRRLSEAVCTAAAQLDKLVPAMAAQGKVQGTSAQAYLEEVAAGAVPEKLLVDAVARLGGRAKGWAKARDGGWVGGEVACVSPPRAQRDGPVRGYAGGRGARVPGEGGEGVVLPPAAWGQVKQLAPAAPAGATPSEIVEHVATRIAAGDSDRAVLRKDVERARKAWRTLHDDVSRRLTPLVPQDTSVAAATENQAALAVVAKVEEQLTALTKQQHNHANELSGQRARRIDLDTRLKGIRTQQSKMVKELTRMCTALRLTPVPVADDVSAGQVDLEATLRLVSEEVAHTANAAQQAGELREQATRSLESLEAERTRALRAEDDLAQLTSCVADTLTALGIDMPCEAVRQTSVSPGRSVVSVASSERGAVPMRRAPSVGGGACASPPVRSGTERCASLLHAAVGMAATARTARTAMARVRVCEGLVDTLLAEAKGSTEALDALGVPAARRERDVAEVRYSLSPMTSVSGGSITPLRPAPPPPVLPGARDDAGAGAPVGADSPECSQGGRSGDDFQRKCKDAIAIMRQLTATAVAAAAMRDRYDAAQTALQQIQNATKSDQSGQLGDATDDVDPAVVATAVTERMEKLLGTSAANAEEKAKLIRQNLELKQDNGAMADELEQLHQDVRDLDARKRQLKRQLESAEMFVAYAEDMKADADEEAGRSPSEEEGEGGGGRCDGEGMFRETVAVRAYQGYLALRKDREALQKRVAALQEEAEDVQLQGEFLGGLAAKLSSLEALAKDTVTFLVPAGETNDNKDQTDGSTSPAKQDPGSGTSDAASVPTRILSSLAALERNLTAMHGECGGLGKRAAKVIGGLRKLVAEHGPAAAAREAIQSVHSLPLPAGARGEDLATLWGRVEGLLAGVVDIPQHIARAHERRLQDEVQRVAEVAEQAERHIRREHALQAEVDVLRAEVAAVGSSRFMGPASVSRSGTPPLQRHVDIHSDSISSVSPQRQPRLAVSGAGAGYADMHSRRLVSPSRSPPASAATAAVGDVLTAESEQTLLKAVRKLEDILGRKLGSHDPRPAGVVARVAALSTDVHGELAHLAHNGGTPRRGALVEVLQSKLADFAAQAATPVRANSDDEWLEGGIRDVVAQLAQLANNIASASAKECPKLLLRSAETGSDDHLGLLQGMRRLHVIIANKVETLPREIKEWRGKHDLLEAHVKRLEAEAGRRGATLARTESAERQATQTLAHHRHQWDLARQALEERVATLEGARDALQGQVDAAQSALALQRMKLAPPPAAERGVSPSVERGAVVHTPQSREQRETVVALRAEVQVQTQQCEAARAALEALEVRMQEKERGKKEYKEKYRMALGEIEKLETEREDMKKSFQAQIHVVKEQLLKLHGRASSGRGSEGGGTTPRVPGRESSTSAQQRAHSTPSKATLRPPMPSTESVTVPQEFSFMKARGRTGCYSCDSPTGPSKYAGAQPRRSQQKRREQSPPAPV